MAQGDSISKVLFGTFMLVSIARISVGLYEWNRNRSNKGGCGCQGKK